MNILRRLRLKTSIKTLNVEFIYKNRNSLEIMGEKYEF